MDQEGQAQATPRALPCVPAGAPGWVRGSLRGGTVVGGTAMSASVSSSLPLVCWTPHPYGPAALGGLRDGSFYDVTSVDGDS